MEQIIKFGISNYLLLCVEAGFSQIQSHILKYVSHLGPGDIKTIEIPRNIVEILIKILYQNHLKSSTLYISF